MAVPDEDRTAVERYRMNIPPVGGRDRFRAVRRIGSGHAWQSLSWLRGGASDVFESIVCAVKRDSMSLCGRKRNVFVLWHKS